MFWHMIKWAFLGGITGCVPGVLALIHYQVTSTGRDWGPIDAMFLLVTVAPLGALIGAIGAVVRQRLGRAGKTDVEKTDKPNLP